MDKIIPKFKGIKAYEEELVKTSTETIIDVQKHVKRKCEEIDPKSRLESNEKRLKTLKDKLDFDKRQQMVVKNAINDCQQRVNKRIVFDEDMSFGHNINEFLSEEKHKTNDNCLQKSKPKGKPLFDSDSEDDSNEDIEANDGKRLKEFGLDFNKKINDKNAEKLIELNSRFAHDLRFKIDERFLDQLEDNEEVVDEKQRNLDLLEEVLGKRLKPIIKDKKLAKNDLFIPRFDPNVDKSFSNEVKSSSVEKRQKKVSFDQKVIDKEVNKSVEELEPKVSNEVYYEVSSDLKDSLSQREEEFSLTKMFGTNSSSADNKDMSSSGHPKDEPFFEKMNKKRKLDVLPNPFRYDSSSSDEEEQEVKVVVGSVSKSKPKDKLKSLNGFRFFFDKKDLRFSEDVFYSEEMVEKVKNNWKERQTMIIRSMGVRKRSAKKNKMSDRRKKIFNSKNNNFRHFKTNDISEDL